MHAKLQILREGKREKKTKYCVFSFFNYISNQSLETDPFTVCLLSPHTDLNFWTAQKKLIKKLIIENGFH